MTPGSTTIVPTAHARLLAAAAAVFGIDATALSDSSSPESVPSWDSLNHLNLMLAVESEFAVALSAEQVMEMGSIALVRSALRQQGVEI